MALKCARWWVPQVWFLNLGLGVDFLLRGVGDADGTATLLREGRVTFHHVQLLPAVAVAQGREGERCVVRELAKLRDELEFRLVGYVVMPEHVHLLVGEPRKGTPSTVLHKLKPRVSRKLRKRRRSAHARQMRLPFEESAEPVRAFWQARFYDFNVYSEVKRIEKLNYMHENPMKRKLVTHPKEWPWSNWGFYAGATKVLVQIDAGK